MRQDVYLSEKKIEYQFYFSSKEMQKKTCIYVENYIIKQFYENKKEYLLIMNLKTVKYARILDDLINMIDSLLN